MMEGSSNYPQIQIDSLKSESTKVIAERVVSEERSFTKEQLELIEKRLVKARTQLMLDKPFLGNLVLRLPLKAAGSWCKTSATDAKSFYYNPEFIERLDTHQIKFVLIHEALHCALTHFARRGNRKKHTWDLACDFAINPLLIKEGFHPPLDVPIFRQYEGMIAEEIYPMIDDNLDQEPMDQHLYDDQNNEDSKDSDGGMREDNLTQQDKNQSGESKNNQSTSSLAQRPQSLNPDEIEKLATQWQKNLASSAQLAQEAGKLDGEFAKLIDFFLQPRVSWQSLLSTFMSRLARDDFSYSRPSRRPGNAILPTLRSHQIDIAVAIDTSGSISQQEIDEFVSEINAIKSTIRSSITLIACDDKIFPSSPWRYESWEEINFPASLGGGKGTNFRPVFELLNSLDNPCDVLIYFTDAKGLFPEKIPNYPVLWLVKGKESVPWGDRIQLN
ncbi:VWA-like domain-containing protein [Gammaproteobacteria bacterium]|jgi:predicted metal-dependent peptidase|nr:VWA-like domain-containing protein [Gammaproteobacteria bacterium]